MEDAVLSGIHGKSYRFLVYRRLVTMPRILQLCRMPSEDMETVVEPRYTPYSTFYTDHPQYVGKEIGIGHCIFSGLQVRKLNLSSGFNLI